MRVISIIVRLVAPGDPALHKSTEDEEHPSLLNKTRCQLCIDAPSPPPPHLLLLPLLLLLLLSSTI